MLNLMRWFHEQLFAAKIEIYFGSLVEVASKCVNDAARVVDWLAEVLVTEQVD